MRFFRSVAPYAVGEAVVDGADLEVHRLHGAEGALDGAEQLVIAHRILGRHALLRDAGAGAVDAVAPRFRHDLLLEDSVSEAALRDVEREVLRDLVLVDDPAHAYADLALGA